MHLLSIITSGALDRLPKLKIVVGHLVLGVDRVLYAMDYPYQFEAGEVVEMDFIETALDRHKFYELNARAVCRL